jgi:opacity protein-like surface antigen
MRRIIAGTIAIAFIVWGRNVNAQTPIAMGILAGANFSTEIFNLQSDTNTSIRPGLLITGQTDWPFIGFVVLQDRLSYIEKGVVVHRNNLLSNSTFTTELNYIELSLAPKLKFGLHDFKPYVYVGPRLGLLVSGNEITQTGNMTTNEDVRSYFNSWDFGLDAGVGISYPVMDGLYFLADAGYGLGLSNLQKNVFQNIDQSFSRDIKIQAGFMLTVYDVAKR